MQIAKSSSGTRTTIIGMVRSTRENSDWKNSMAITNPTTMSVYRAVRRMAYRPLTRSEDP